MTRSTGTYRVVALTLCFALLAPASAWGLSHLSGAPMDMSSTQAGPTDTSDPDESDSRVPCPPTGTDIEVCCQVTAVVQTVAPRVKAPGGWLPLWSIDDRYSGTNYPTVSAAEAPPVSPPSHRKTPVHILNASFLL